MVNQNERHFFSVRYGCISALLCSSEQSERQELTLTTPLPLYI